MAIFLAPNTFDGGFYDHSTPPMTKDRVGRELIQNRALIRATISHKALMSEIACCGGRIYKSPRGVAALVRSECLRTMKRGNIEQAERIMLTFVDRNGRHSWWKKKEI